MVDPSLLSEVLGAVDSCASTKSQVIVTESLSVLALPKLLIISDNMLSLPETVTKVHS